MANFYEILGIPQSADSSEIRAAYKKLAFQFHPDLHPNDPQAEERFKQINEAYHTLSDPVKKSRYDARLNAYTVVTESSYDEQAWRAYRHRQYMRWKAAQESRYKFDRNYFKIQGLAFLVFLIIAGFCYGLIHTITYFQEKQMAEQLRKNMEQVERVHTLFATGHIDEAFKHVLVLMQQDPLEYRFTLAYDSMLQTLRYRVKQQYAANDLAASVTTLRFLQRYENPTRFETLRMKAICEYQMEQYDSTLATLEHIRKMQPWNFELVYQMGIISLDNLNKPEKAIGYFTEGKRMFKESMSRIYGEAFEVVMIPADVPEIYYHLFEARARSNMMLNNFEEALTDCNWAVFLRPQQAEAWKMRAMCRIALGRTYRLCEDLKMARKLGKREVVDLQRKFCR
ncbi:MAG: J domain-containing protein [Cyclobacteriaceae bacterium]|nr:J domain-containing protein [Cyclobacteriaceae bacterium]